MSDKPPEIKATGTDKPRPMTVLEAMQWAIARQERINAMYAPPPPRGASYA
jgi:hypothetical protein